MLDYLLFSAQFPKNFRGSCSACTFASWGWSPYSEIWWDGSTYSWGRSVLTRIDNIYFFVVVKMIISNFVPVILGMDSMKLSTVYLKTNLQQWIQF